MQVNADFSRRCLIHSARLEWSPSPIAGVDRRMLDRVGHEVARATSVVWYAAASRFSPHVHGGGEEIFVLDGVFQDEHGDFPAGSYLRNPPGTRHTPGSLTGCRIFVKLWQFDGADRKQVRIDSARAPRLADPARSGVVTVHLFRDEREEVRLERWQAGARASMSLPGGAELLVVDGSLTEQQDALERESWLRMPAASSIDATAGPDGCLVWMKTGHLLSRT